MTFPGMLPGLMQRIGRVNRVGTESTRIYIYNFFPTSRTDSEIELNKKAYIKLQAFHSALGEDGTEVFWKMRNLVLLVCLKKFLRKKKDEG